MSGVNNDILLTYLSIQPMLSIKECTTKSSLPFLLNIFWKDIVTQKTKLLFIKVKLKSFFFGSSKNYTLIIQNVEVVYIYMFTVCC